MVRLLLVKPKKFWCSVPRFNPTMVRLLPNLFPTKGEDCLFQSHNGAIAAGFILNDFPRNL